MAPQLAAAAATVAPAPADGSDGGGLSQGQIGGILVGVVAFVVLLFLFWYWLTHSEGYAAYRDERRFRQRLERLRQRDQWERRRRRPRSYYETEVSYESDSETTEVSRRQRPAASMAAAARMQHMMAAAAAAEQQQLEAERRRRAAGVATTPDYVLNPPPLRFPPTARRTSYVHTRHPQIPGIRRFP
ncbi:hypothetical protein SPBR_07905 [Sporothrix brasiliensis 5110]|uniref:Uncharacterized protein n=1 Tax=Sporothrix brasiliensis 5110 TaxID=1398154 RepID=A0A0C2FDX6_9PEZI|nr:uncharacterized protein SPBR_07905 [Sporothrix brasiliensis 5110]KIH89338.1 hypothetical protein SPBR_07905 [Sporothrix brasiliensis 5110]